MPKPIFDINEYELRGITPPTFSEAQKKRLNDVLSRANGQIDWTAQLLGFNGPNYWGLPSPKADGSYDWKGLPDTMNQKRQLQTTTFGVYDKNKEYSTRPAPFNRSNIKASGDAKFHIWESNGKTQISPLGQGELITYGVPDLFVGGEYTFDEKVEFLVTGSENEALRWTFFTGENREWTRMLLKQQTGLIRVGIKGSNAEPAFLQPRLWEDISDWRSPAVKSQFIGLWGNKGNNFSFDAAFDALELHGFDETDALEFENTKSCLTLDEILAKAGLKTTTWTKFYNNKFGIKVGDCPVVYPLPADTVEDDFTYYTCDDCNYTVELSQTQTVVIKSDNDSFDNKEYNAGLPKPICLVTDGFYDQPTDQICENADEGEYDRVLRDAIPCTGTDFTVEGIKEICINYTAKTECAYVDFPCIEYVFDPSLDDGTYPIEAFCPDNPGPWMIADDGEYDTIPTCYSGVVQGKPACEPGVFCGFNDGEYDKLVQPVCELPDVGPECDDITGGFYTIVGPPDYADCDCAFTCCEVNNGFYFDTFLPYTGPEIVNNGVYTIEPVIVYDNIIYDHAPADAKCDLDNGLMQGQPPTAFADEGEYDRYFLSSEVCVENQELPEPAIPCPVKPVRVDLAQALQSLAYVMKPDVSNALTPLRIWKNRILTVTDEVPGADTDRYNFLVADDNKGVESTDEYRYFVRLPVEYPRNGPQWNKAEAVCNNQSYFSAPPKLSQTQNAPPVLRPVLFAEEYTNPDLPIYTLFYNESFLVSTVEVDAQADLQSGFQDSGISSESVETSGFEFASITNYDAFEERTPYPNGEWRGRYYAFGVNPTAPSGFIDDNLIDQRLKLVAKEDEPVYDMSRIKRPNIEFPNSVDQADLKNYVVSYAYFISDYSSSDDPVFDPNNEICWRSETLACETLDSNGVCISKPLPSNTAYLLHPA